MIGLRVDLNGTLHYLDMFEDVQVKLNSSFAEVQNITQRNSTYSISFYIPGSDKNNKVMEHFYDVNSSYTDFDLSKKMNADLTYDGWELFNGYCRLNFVNIENREILFNLTFYSELGDVVSNIGDKFMKELDLSSLSHPFDTPQVILDSLKDPDLVPPPSPSYSYQDGRTNWVLFNYGYEYDSGGTLNALATPILDFSNGNTYGYFDYIDTPVRYYYFKPAVQVRELYTQIFKQAGYKIQSDFFDTAYFKRYYLPLAFNPNGLYLKQGENIEYKVVSSGDTIDWVSKNFYNPTLDVVERFRLTPTTIVDNQNINGLSPFSMKLPSEGVYTIRVGVEGYNQEQIPETLPLIADFTLRFDQIEDGLPNGVSGTTLDTLMTASLLPGGVYTNSIDYTFYGLPNYFYAFDFFLGGSATFIPTYFSVEILSAPKVVNGDIDYSLEFPDDKFKQIDFIRSINTLFNIAVVPSTEYPKTFVIEPMIDFIGKGDVLDWTRKVDRSQPIQIAPTSVIVNGTLNFNFLLDKDFGNTEYNKVNNRIFGSEQVQLNTDYKDAITNFDTGLSTQVDYTLSNQTEPYSTLAHYYITKENNKEGQAEFFYNPYVIIPRLYFRGNNLPMGNINGISVPFIPECNCFEYELNNRDLVDAKPAFYSDCYGMLVEILIPADTSVNICSCEGSIITAGIVDITKIDRCSTLTGTTIVIDNWYMENEEIDVFPENHRFITYPYALWDFSHYTNFRNVDSFDQLEYKFPEYEDMYDVYYKDYIDDLSSIDSRIMDCYVFLEPQEIKNIKFNEKIYIDGSYFRINKIENYDPTTTQPVKVQLIKLTKSLQPHRVGYFDLINCGEGDDLHTNTDLTFGVFQFVGNYWKIGENCYEIVKGEYNPSYTYQPISTTYSGDSFVPNVYTNCGCNTKIEKTNIYQDTPPVQPTPTPTPTPSSTPGLTPTPSYLPVFYYILEKCGVPQQLLGYSNSPVSIGSVVGVMIGGVRNCYVVVRQTTITNTNEITSSWIDCDACAQPDPSPSPTPTISPTPSSTPCECYTYSITNTNEESILTYEAVLCEDGCLSLPATYNISPGSSIEVCACNGSVSTTNVEVIIIKGSCCGTTPTPTPTPTQTKTPTPTPSIVVYDYLGRSAPDQSSGAQACESYLTIRSYYGLKPLSSLTIGDFLYDSYPSTTTNGGGLWIALKVGGTGTGYAFQVDSTGEILDKYTC